MSPVRRGKGQLRGGVSFLKGRSQATSDKARKQLRGCAAARNSLWRSARSKTTIPPRNITKTTWKRTPTATATSPGRRWSCSPGFASIRATTGSPRRRPSGHFPLPFRRRKRRADHSALPQPISAEQALSALTANLRRICILTLGRRHVMLNCK